LILLAAFSSLRWCELAALRPEDTDLDSCTVRVTGS
jgi:integrase